MNLNTSLAQGRTAMTGEGLDPQTIYGIPPTAAAALPARAAQPPGAAALAPPAPAASPSSFYGVNVGGSTTAPTGMPNVQWGIGSTAAPPQANSHNLHPDITHDDIVNFLLPKVGAIESNNNYTADRAKTHPGQTASGRYQYIDSTWNNYGGYKRAVDAPPEVQDQRAKEDFAQALQKYGGDPFKAVVNHYYPKVADNPTLWNSPLVDKHGKEIKGAETPASYASKVLGADRVSSYLAAQSQPQPQG